MTTITIITREPGDDGVERFPLDDLLDMAKQAHAAMQRLIAEASKMDFELHWNVPTPIARSKAVDVTDAIISAQICADKFLGAINALECQQ